jgi:glycosyltransferase involved in cell wall biosynthesis
VPRERLLVLPHGIERPAQGVSSGEDPEIAGKPSQSHRFRVAYIGGLTPQKGVHVLTSAFNEAFEQAGAPDAELWIAGDESADPTYFQHLQSLAGPNARFLGLLNRQAVWQCLAQVDVLAVPSLWHETFSIIAHEAFVARRPVIASRLGALTSAVHDGVDGLLVTPGDVSAWRAALQRVAADSGLRQHLTDGIKPPVTIHEHVDRLEAVYFQATSRA